MPQEGGGGGGGGGGGESQPQNGRAKVGSLISLARILSWK